MINKKMLNKQLSTNQSIKISLSPQKQQQNSIVEKTTNIIDQKTKHILQSIMLGAISISPQQQHINKQQKKLSIFDKMNSMDPLVHKRNIKKFINQNRTFRKNLQIRSLQMEQKLKSIQEKQKLQSQKIKLEIRQNRRINIQKRLKQKQQRAKTIQIQTLQSTQKMKKVRKLNHQIILKHQQQIKKNILGLQNNQVQQKIALIKEKMKPLNMSEIFNHQKLCNKRIKQRNLQRKLEQQKLKNNWISYSPPKFVPKSYLLAQQQQTKAKIQQQNKFKAHIINEIKKKKFLQALEQIKNAEKQFQKKNRKKTNYSINQEKYPEKIQVDEIKRKQLGNQYLKDIFKNSKKKIQKQQLNEKDQKMYTPIKRKIKTQYQLQIIRQQRISKTHKIRLKKINQIVKSDGDQIQKVKKLKKIAEMLDTFASKKLSSTKSKKKEENYQEVDLLDRNQGASAIMNSIYAKLAILQITQPTSSHRNK